MIMDEALTEQEVERQMDLKSYQHAKAGGFTLLEALIALVIFSVALLGLAKMYTQMMSMSHSAYFRTLATIQVNDLEERIRANPKASGEGDYKLTSCPAPAGTLRAPEDLITWCANTSALFGGQLVSASVTEDGSDYVVRLTWSERGLDGDTGDQAFENVTFDYRVRK
ncbi:type IV pilus modification protein PilV [Marinobacterium weihaiense]|uniref:Type IV pilus modification protein PilV n=1 Tax=Marinobacterium weihaiense TaxID=2851016 RepID=A0ABS6MAW9_9GAMM|nr:type IV pilus modification protein PilV [Marinobacterium weihaiense]MBV0932996.1 type IV pilus modification protein PilV [Marinobacterium weihaiense]